MRIGSLFSGYGGFDIGVQAALGGEVAWHVEYDKAPSRILAYHYPEIPNLGDVTAVDFTAVEPVDVLTGGYPCQPFSHAGKRKGTDDDRHLWPHVLRALREMGPRLAILENVRGHLSLGFDVVLADLADLGWSATWGVVRASDAGACHQRARLFILAYPDSAPGKNSVTGMGLSDFAGRREDTAHAQGYRWHEGWPKPAGIVWGPDVTQCGNRVSADSHDIRHQRASSSWGRGFGPANRGVTSTDADLTGSQARGTEPGRARGQQAAGQREPVGRHATTSWGDYSPAIARWEHVIGRPAPQPTEPGRTGQPRLSPRFVEWMMGLPDGWVTDPAIGISRNDQLKALGNGVVPQQAALALSLLRDHVQAVAA